MAKETKQTVMIVVLCVFWYICSSTNNVIGEIGILGDEKVSKHPFYF